MNKILVTGGLGYIGSHTVVELLEQGKEVIAIDNLNNSDIRVLTRIEQICGRKPIFIEGDILDKDLLRKVFDEHKPEGIIHFAAYKAVGESTEKPVMYYENNLSGLINLIGVAEEFEVYNFVFSSSCTVYGDTSNSPIGEDEPLQLAISPYGTTKLLGEKILQDLVNFKPFKVVNLRYFNPVGAHPSALIGELPLGVPSNLVPYITQTAAGIREQLVIFGNDYNTPDGTNIRDFIHVVDLAKAHIKALDYAANNDFKLEYFNLGTGKGHSVLEVVKCFERVNNVKLNYRFGERRAGDVVQIWADASKADRVLDWRTELSLETMMESAWKWQQQLRD